jgi:uncharacterized protein YjdB
LTATVAPSNATNQSVTWSSSNTTVATVSSSGLVSAKAVGSATITVTTNDGSKKATCSVSVSPISVTGVSLDKTSLTLTEGDIYTLTATVAPSNATDKSVSWSSSNTSVATVSSSGVVTAQSTGSATITVTTNDGAKKATCSVTVQKKTIHVTGVSLNRNSLSMMKGDTQTLIATITPSNADNQEITWSSDNESVATVNASGLVSAVGGGSATITVRTMDGGFEARCAVTVSVDVNGISLNKTSLKMTQYDTETLIATVVPNDASNKKVIWSSSNPSVASVTSSGLVSAISAGSTTITATTEDGGYTATCSISVKADSHEAVDLGLSVKWSSMNFGATSANQVGGYYMWGDPTGNAMAIYYSAPNVNSISGTDYDIVHKNWGGNWRIPTASEIRELYNKCSWTWSSSGGVSGVRITGTNGNSIFIPVSGYVLPDDGPIGTTQTTDKSTGYIMSGDSSGDSNGRFAYIFYFRSSSLFNNASFNADFMNFPIRPIRTIGLTPDDSSSDSNTEDIVEDGNQHDW